MTLRETTDIAVIGAGVIGLTIALELIDQGHEVGNLAKRLFPDGIDIPSDDFAANLEQSHALLSARRPLFEAAFMSGGKYARLDVLQPAGQDVWNIIEVKSSTSVKVNGFQL